MEPQLVDDRGDGGVCSAAATAAAIVVFFVVASDVAFASVPP